MQFCSITITEVYSGALKSSVLTLSSDILYKTDWIAKSLVEQSTPSVCIGFSQDSMMQFLHSILSLGTFATTVVGCGIDTAPQFAPISDSAKGLPSDLEDMALNLTGRALIWLLRATIKVRNS